MKIECLILALILLRIPSYIGVEIFILQCSSISQRYFPRLIGFPKNRYRLLLKKDGLSMLQLSNKIATRTSVLINIFFITFFITFLVSHTKYANTSPSVPSGFIRIVIDVRNLQLILFKDNLQLKNFPIAIGKPGTPSPVGNWEIISKEKWGEGFGSRWLGLNVPFGMYGIHGTNNPGSIGNIISSGCIRMFNNDVEQVYNLVQIGTPVHIIGDPFMGRRVLVRGLAGSDVLFLQKRLRQLGLFPYQPNGIFGYYTERAIIQFQKQNHLPPTGQVRNLEYQKLKLTLTE